MNIENVIIALQDQIITQEELIQAQAKAIEELMKRVDSLVEDLYAMKMYPAMPVMPMMPTDPWGIPITSDKSAPSYIVTATEAAEVKRDRAEYDYLVRSHISSAKERVL